MTQIKICGITRMQDIEAANALRPDYIGFVFANGSKRRVTPGQAQHLRAHLAEGIRAVGVFVDEPPENVARLLADGVIDIAQLHGAEDEAYIARLRELTDKLIIKAFRLGAGAAANGNKSVAQGEDGNNSAVTETNENTSAAADAIEPENPQDAILRAASESTADMILLDSGAGTGMVLNWELLRDFQRPFFLAGGLNPGNVTDAVLMLHPAAVDVSSGVESDGVKDTAKMKAFVEAVRRTQ